MVLFRRIMAPSDNRLLGGRSLARWFRLAVPRRPVLTIAFISVVCASTTAMYSILLHANCLDRASAYCHGLNLSLGPVVATRPCLP
jgi:hypothetical protein